MSATAVCEEQVQVRRERRPCAGPEGVTLGQLLARAHEAVQAGGVADCPFCSGTIRAHGALGGRCDDCGSGLA
jgi:tRNA(Ile2) C34 agmatinyltransferase TiaS